MDAGSSLAQDGEILQFEDAGQLWTLSWFPPGRTPVGTPHGSAAICFADRDVVILVSSSSGEYWEFPGGRPFSGEDWRATMMREVREEACARVVDASLLGFSVGKCIEGERKGVTLVRSAWRAMVELESWIPAHEMTSRRLVKMSVALDEIRIPFGARSLYERWMHEAIRRSD